MSTTFTATAIRSHNDAYAFADLLNEILEIGQAFSMGTIDLVKVDSSEFIVRGCEYTRNSSNPRFMTCELADMVIWAERRMINDFLRTYARGGYTVEELSAKSERICRDGWFTQARAYYDNAQFERQTHEVNLGGFEYAQTLPDWMGYFADFCVNPVTVDITAGIYAEVSTQAPFDLVHFCEARKAIPWADGSLWVAIRPTVTDPDGTERTIDEWMHVRCLTEAEAAGLWEGGVAGAIIAGKPVTIQGTYAVVGAKEEDGEMRVFHTERQGFEQADGTVWVNARHENEQWVHLRRLTEIEQSEWAQVQANALTDAEIDALAAEFESRCCAEMAESIAEHPMSWDDDSPLPGDDRRMDQAPADSLGLSLSEQYLDEQLGTTEPEEEQRKPKGIPGHHPECHCLYCSAESPHYYNMRQ